MLHVGQDSTRSQPCPQTLRGGSSRQGRSRVLWWSFAPKKRPVKNASVDQPESGVASVISRGALQLNYYDLYNIDVVRVQQSRIQKDSCPYGYIIRTAAVRDFVLYRPGSIQEYISSRWNMSYIYNRSYIYCCLLFVAVNLEYTSIDT